MTVTDGKNPLREAEFRTICGHLPTVLQHTVRVRVTRTTTMVDDAQRFMAAAVRRVATSGVITVLHWIMLPALRLTVLPAGIGEILRARTDSALAPGQLTVAGCHLQVGEPLVRAAGREAAEETGIRITSLQQKFCGIVHHHAPDGMDRITAVSYSTAIFQMLTHGPSYSALNRPTQGGAL
ncbi:NUDIX hydrolase [Streptomyces avermitilis]|uniref:NUDIX hydrolase n=1 Tax=Streptomyces avermitilis TaxID=33903 RepID=UPI0033B39747